MRQGCLSIAAVTAPAAAAAIHFDCLRRRVQSCCFGFGGNSPPSAAGFVHGITSVFLNGCPQILVVDATEPVHDGVVAVKQEGRRDLDLLLDHHFLRERADGASSSGPFMTGAQHAVGVCDDNRTIVTSTGQKSCRERRRGWRRTRVSAFSSPNISQKLTSRKASASLTYFLANICAKGNMVSVEPVCYDYDRKRATLALTCNAGGDIYRDCLCCSQTLCWLCCSRPVCSVLRGLGMHRPHIVHVATMLGSAQHDASCTAVHGPHLAWPA